MKENEEFPMIHESPILLSKERLVTVKHSWLPADEGMPGGCVQIMVYQGGVITGIWSGSVRAVIALEKRKTWSWTFPNGDKWLAKREDEPPSMFDNPTSLTLTIREKRKGSKSYNGNRYSTPMGTEITLTEWRDLVRLSKEWLKEDDAYDIECKKRNAERENERKNPTRETCKACRGVGHVPITKP